MYKNRLNMVLLPTNSVNCAKHKGDISPISKKVIQIKNLKDMPDFGDEYVEKELKEVSRKLTCLVNEENPNVSLEQLYRSVEHLIEINQKEKLVEILNEVNSEFLSTKVDKLLLSDTTQNFFDSLISLWKCYCKKVIILKNIFILYGRFVQKDLKYHSIQSMCFDLFKNKVILNPILSNKLSTQVLITISEERYGANIDREQMKTILSILTTLDVYREIFEEKFLAESMWYFQNEGRNLSERRMDVKKYLYHVARKIEDEENRDYVLNESIDSVFKILYREMVEAHLKEILKRGFQTLMDENLLQPLHLMYKLISKILKGVQSISEYFQNYAEHLCFMIVNRGVDKAMIQELLDLKDRLDKVICECFHENKSFYDIVRNVFDKMINVKNSESALYLAKYLDSKLRSKNISEEELESTLNKVMVIFRMIHGKDIFEAFYRKDLAKRLLFGKSTNQDMEQSIVIKLKQECGDAFTSKIEGMLTDINLSMAINTNFREFLSNTQPELLEKTDLCISVLTSSFWSKSVKNSAIILPDVLINYQAIFLRYYISIHTGRKLDWQSSLGHCVVRATFSNGVKELLVSLYQTLILLLFNDHDKLSFTEIQELTKMESKELIATLHSLSCSKIKILKKEPLESNVAINDTFEFNYEFNDKLFRIKINQAQLKETAEDVKATERSVLIDRQFQIDAAIVRIMKSKKVVKHNELLAELFKILDIPVRPQDLKKRIELLIDKDYIKRDFNNAATYTYVA